MEDRKRLPISTSDFKSVRDNNRYFVDKSLLIKDLVDDGFEAVLITRPRRFGKTLNMSMLKYYFQKSREDYSYLFRDLKIWDAGDFYVEEQGQYPMISLSMSSVIAESPSIWRDNLWSLIADVFKGHAYLLNSSTILKEDRILFQSICSKSASIGDYRRSLNLLSRLLFEYHQRQVMILIDEYDAPLNHAYVYGYYHQVLEEYKSFLHGGFKDNIYLKRGVLTGIYRVAQESLFSQLNNLYVADVTDHRYADKYGFVEVEVDEILAHYGLNHKIHEVREWYNGYVFGGNTVIYNPWSIFYYISQETIGPYWVNTATNEIIVDLLGKITMDTQHDLMDLLQGRKIKNVTLDTGINFKDIMKSRVISADVLYNFFLVSGYLRYRNYRMENRRVRVDVESPNEEMYSLYETAILSWILSGQESSDTFADQVRSLLSDLMDGRFLDFESRLKRVIRRILSYHDTPKNQAEIAYHMLLLVICMNLEDRCSVWSNLESGDGRPDIMMIPKDRSKKGIIMELMVAKSKRELDLKTAVEMAIEQSIERRYVERLVHLGFRKAILIGIAFFGKEMAMDYREVDLSDQGT